MVKMTTAVMAMALMLIAGSVYACDDKSDAGAAGTKMTASGSCSSDHKAVSADAGDKAETMTAKSCPAMEKTSGKATVKKADAKSDCCAPDASKASTRDKAKTDSKASSAEAPRASDAGVVAVTGGSSAAPAAR